MKKLYQNETKTNHTIKNWQKIPWKPENQKTGKKHEKRPWNIPKETLFEFDCNSVYNNDEDSNDDGQPDEKGTFEYA